MDEVDVRTSDVIIYATRFEPGKVVSKRMTYADLVSGLTSSASAPLSSAQTAFGDE